ncbi:DUF3994 domain-containing protein [Bacillus cereus]|uniref:DUF3994 domain-containing protein n=1 Tax=Bacillus cereus TaxID=1396 RepID=UPI0009B52918|nr:DUF3994 domain-containing protein [Bacillus cereus]
MKAKKLITLALPVMLLAGCTLETYGLTQSEYRQVDKEFKADKMVKDMKQLHYSDEQIEAQLRGALASLDSDKEDKKSTSTYETEEETEKDVSKINDDNIDGFVSDSFFMSLTDGEIGISSNSKELVGHWGIYKNNFFSVGLDLKKDGSYMLYESRSKKDHKENYIKGKWTYDSATKKLNLAIDKYVQEGKNQDKDSLNSNIEYTIKSFKNDVFQMEDVKENVLKAKKVK